MGQYWSSRLTGVWGDGDQVAGYIYKVQSATGRVYVGSTGCKDLNRRLRVHEAAWRSWQAGRSAYCSAFEVLEDGGCEIELLEVVKSNDRSVVRQREAYYFQLFGDKVVNLRNPYRQKWQKKKQHRDCMRRYQQKYVGKTQERVRESNSVRVKCDVCNVWVSRGYRSQHERTNKHFNNVLLNCE